MLKVKSLIKRFNLNILNSEIADFEREIDSPSIHRNGLELLGVVKFSMNKNVIGWGTKESKFFLSLDKERRVSAIKNVISNNTPLIILSIGVDEEVVQDILKVANEFNVALCKTDLHLSNITTTVGLYILKYFAESVDVHGSLVVVNGIGVMIVGKSGIGKSEAVLELIQKGSKFVTDDTVVLKRIGNEYSGEPSKLTKDFLEARGIGLINIPKIYGLQSTLDNSRVDLVVELVPSEELNKVDRLGNRKLHYEALGSSIPLMKIPVENGRTLSALVEAAVNVYNAKIHGDNPLDVITERNKDGA